MEVELAISFFLLLALTSLATVDMAFGQLSDVGLRRLAAEAEEHQNARYAPLLKEILDNRARFSFTLSAAIQILLVVFSVLVNYIALQWFSANSLALFISLASGLVLAGILRQFIPRMLSLSNPEGKLLRLLPVLRPFYRMLAFAAEPWHRSFDRLRQQEELEEARDEQADDDDADDIQALIDVGEAEGIIEEEERELIHSAFEFGDKSVDEVMSGEEPEEIVPAGDGVYEVLGSTEIGKIERLFDMEIEADDFTTIAGLVIAHKGSVPRPGEQLSFRGLDVEVLAADEKRIGRLSVKRAPETGEAAANSR